MTPKTMPILAAIALFLLLGLAHAQSPISSSKSVCQVALTPDWIIYALAAISIGMTLYALAYMLGSILNRPQVKGMVRAGLADIAGLFIFLMFIVALSQVLCNATFDTIGIDTSKFANNNYLLSKGINIAKIPFFDMGETYLNLLYFLGEKLYKSLLIQLLYVSAVTSVKVSAGTMIGEIQPLSGLDPLLGIGNIFFSSLTILLIGISAQMFLLKFFAMVGIPVFLPLGVLMRAIPPTRTFGAALIGFAVSMSFFYPLILSYNMIILTTAVPTDEAMLNSFLYNSPMCDDPADCQQNCNSQNYVVDTTGGITRYFCAPCILVGKPPDDDPSLCCPKVSKYSDGVCSIPDDTDPETMGSGGIIAAGATPAGYGITYFIGASFILLIGSRLLGSIPLLDVFSNAIAGALITIMQIGMAVVYKLNLGLIVNPLAVMGIILFFNSNFFFVGFVLPILEFVVMVEFVRTLTGSLGEPIDIIQLLKVI